MVKTFVVTILRIILCLGIFIGLSTLLIYFQIHKISVSDLCDRIQGPCKADDSDLIEILKTRFIDKPSIKNYNLSQDPLYKRSKNKYSWKFIYDYAKEIFGRHTNGFFVEAGALDGEYLSNTLWLEMELKWTGLLIEPDPNNYKDLLLKNRKSYTSNTCISSERHPKRATLVSRRRITGTAPYDKWLFRALSHEFGYSNESRLETVLAETTPTYYSVQCFPLLTYLLALNKTTIDFLSLDIQGAELDVLKSFPFNQINVRVMVIEHANTQFYDKSFVHFFNERGYELIGCNGEPNYIFIRSDQFEADQFEKKIIC